MDEAELWNTRYAESDFLYGTDPNAFLKEQCELLASPVLSISEGEGRNAVFMASRGLDVLGVDISEVALARAEQLARSRGVTIRTRVADLAEFEPGVEQFGSVVSISGHLHGAVRARLYPLLERALKPGGIFLLESYAENQLKRTTGGPREADMLMTVEKVRRELPGLEPVLLQEIVRNVSEGNRHNGLAAVVQFIGRKPVR